MVANISASDRRKGTQTYMQGQWQNFNAIVPQFVQKLMGKMQARRRSCYCSLLAGIYRLIRNSVMACTIISAISFNIRRQRHFSNALQHFFEIIAGRKFKIKKQFLDDLAQTNMQAAVKNLNKPLLILHSPLDDIVGIGNAAHIFQVARHPKSFISLDRADHLLTNAKDSLYVGTIISAWATKYIKTRLQ